MRSSFVIVMGVSGSGKTTLAKGLAYALEREYAEGDDFHPPSNIAKMRAGSPLTDEDREPWLAAISAWMGEQERAQNSAIITCSALRRSYRDALRERHGDVRFLHVDVPRAELERRLTTRQGHFMPAKLLASQLATLEPLGPGEPGVVIHPLGDTEHALQQALVGLHLQPVRPLPPPAGALDAITSAAPKGSD